MFLNNLEKRLVKDLPGLQAQMLMAPKNRPFLIAPENPVLAAVLVLLFKRSEGWYTVLIKRNEYDGPHSGQISLPGGRKEQSDRSLQETALRETEEELGIPSSHIRILGNLTPLHIPASNYLVHPFVGYYKEIPSWKPDLSEVNYVIEVGLNHLLDTGNMKLRKISSGKVIWEAPYYDVSGEQVWGATAMIMSEFLQIVRNVEM